MTIGNYTQLQTAITTWLVRTDLPNSQILDFITLAEAKLNRALRLLQQETLATVTLSSAASTASLPSRFLELISFKWTDITGGPTQKSLGEVADIGVGLGSSRPQYFALSSNFVFERTADAAYTLNCRYYKSWNIAADTTNWLLTNAPDAYLYYALDAAGIYVRKPPAQIADTEDQVTWAGLAMGIIQELNNLDARSRKGATLSVDSALLTYRRAGSFDINRGY